jgi:hypothetical protein
MIGLPTWSQPTPPEPGLPVGFPEFSRWSLSPFSYSTGIQLGQILNLRRERPVFSTFEGDLMLGFGTSFGEKVDRVCVESELPTQSRARISSEELARLTQEARNSCALFRNPWRFSFLSSNLFDRIVPMKGRPVLLYFINYFSAIAPSHILKRTSNTLLDAFPVDPNLALATSFRIPSWKALHPESGFISGRIVRASLENSLRKTFEVVIQENENSDSFRAMTVSNEGLFRYITHAMLTGRQLRIEYIRLFSRHSALIQSIWTHMTDYRIIGVEIIPD